MAFFTVPKASAAPMKMTYEKILGAIQHVEGNDLMGSGKMSKREHLADLLFAMFQQADPVPEKVAEPLMLDQSKEAA